MVAMRMQESQFGAPEGIYVATFLGVEPFKSDGPPRMGKDGKPMGPAYEWQFLIEEGPYKGKTVTRITGITPTEGNACGRLLRGVIGRKLALDEEANPDAFKGQRYQVVVRPSTMNPDRTQVDAVHAIQGAAPTSSAPPKGPPPRQGAKPAPALRRFWVATGDDNPSLWDEKQVQEWIAANHKDPATVEVCLEGADAWSFAAEHGFTDKVPF